MKRFFYVTLLSAFAASSVVAWFSPQAITWYFAPPTDLVISCKDAVEWGINSYRKTVLIGGLFGFIVGVAIYFFLESRNKSKSAATRPNP